LEIINKIKENIKEENDCEIWHGTLSQKNYPNIRVLKKSYYVAKYLWNYHNPNDLLTIKFIMNHTCNNNLCVKIDHLKKVPRIKEIDYKKIWKRLLKKGERQKNGCLYWTGCKMPNGYGQGSLGGKPITVHRLSCMIKMNVKELDKKDGDVRLFVRHLCNNILCFEPEHLKLGTQYENDYEDKIKAGTLKRGETHYNSSITEELAKKIKLSKPKLNIEYKTKKEIAKLFNVSISTIIKIEKGNICEIISKEIQENVKKSLQPRYFNYKSQKDRAREFSVSKQIVKSIDCGKSWANLKDIDGNTSSKRKIKSRELRKNANKRIWDDKMWENAKSRLLNKSELQKEKNKFTGTECRIWNGTKASNKYGAITIYGRTMPVHVVSCSVKNKRHREEKEVTRHLCGTKLCINEEHLEFGTKSENAIDNLKHGKACKLSENQVKEIREKYLNGSKQINLSKNIM
jgi:hypothetical protein